VFDGKFGGSAGLPDKMRRDAKDAKDPPLQLQADIADTDGRYQYRLTQIVLAYTISAPK
jgi:hypothetical protein